MNWFYAQNGQQMGPVVDEDLPPLIASGAIGPATLVWHNGLPGWQPFAQASATLPATLRPAMAGAAAEWALCSQCGNTFPADEVVPVGGYNVCAACKPLLLQKLQQGVGQAASFGIETPQFAGFWIRFAAAIVDGLILIPVSLLLQFIFGLLGQRPILLGPLDAQNAHYASKLLATFAVYQLVALALFAVYNGICLSRFGGMPGMLICGLRVIRPDGGPISFWRGVGRFFANYLNVFTLDLSYLLIVFDDQKRALQDFICDTRVIYK